MDFCFCFMHQTAGTEDKMKIVEVISYTFYTLNRRATHVTIFVNK